MGVNAVRTTHNIPAVELLELADDTHANEHSLEITRYLKEQVLLHDPYVMHSLQLAQTLCKVKTPEKVLTY